MSRLRGVSRSSAHAHAVQVAAQQVPKRQHVCLRTVAAMTPITMRCHKLRTQRRGGRVAGAHRKGCPGADLRHGAQSLAARHILAGQGFRPIRQQHTCDGAASPRCCGSGRRLHQLQGYGPCCSSCLNMAVTTRCLIMQLGGASSAHCLGGWLQGRKQGGCLTASVAKHCQRHSVTLSSVQHLCRDVQVARRHIEQRVHPADMQQWSGQSCWFSN